MYCMHTVSIILNPFHCGTHHTHIYIYIYKIHEMLFRASIKLSRSPRPVPFRSYEYCNIQYVFNNSIFTLFHIDAKTKNPLQWTWYGITWLSMLNCHDVSRCYCIRKSAAEPLSTIWRDAWHVQHIAACISMRRLCAVQLWHNSFRSDHSMTFEWHLCYKSCCVLILSGIWMSEWRNASDVKLCSLALSGHVWPWPSQRVLEVCRANPVNGPSCHPWLSASFSHAHFFKYHRTQAWLKHVETQTAASLNNNIWWELNVGFWYDAQSHAKRIGLSKTQANMFEHQVTNIKTLKSL